MARAAASKNTTGIKVEPGLRFRWSVADANPLWEVKKLRGKGVWECEVVNEPYTIGNKTYDGEFAGKKQPFDEKDIGRAVAMERMFDGIADKAEKFYNDLKVGQVVHYSNGFGAFVRCEVVMKDGQKVLLPKALVGDWKTYDLYTRRRNGRVDLGYNPKQIEAGETMRPHASNIYEHQALGSRHNVDPRTLEPVSYKPPPMTAEEAEAAKHWRVVEGLQETLRKAENPVVALREVQAWANAWANNTPTPWTEEPNDEEDQSR